VLPLLKYDFGRWPDPGTRPVDFTGYEMVEYRVEEIMDLNILSTKFHRSGIGRSLIAQYTCTNTIKKKLCLCLVSPLITLTHIYEQMI
jgi:hypothetical protein